MAALARLLVVTAIVLALVLVGAVALGVSGALHPRAAAAPPAVSPPQAVGDGVVAQVAGRVERRGTPANGRLRAPSGAVVIAMRCSGDGRVRVTVGARSTSAACRRGEVRTRTGQFLSIGTEQVGWRVATAGRVAWAVTLSAG